MKLPKFFKKSFMLLSPYLMLSAPFLGVEIYAMILLRSSGLYPLAFSLPWALLFASLFLILPKLGGQIAFGIVYYLSLMWTMAQTGYYQVFGKLMWFSTASYAGEGATFVKDVIAMFPWSWWVFGAFLALIGAAVIKFYPNKKPHILGSAIVSVVMLALLFVVPELVFIRDNYTYGAKNEFGQSSSFRSTYNTMYDAKKVYEICGVYQLAVRDLWKHEIYPYMPEYKKDIQNQKEQISAYFDKKGAHKDNDMTGAFAGKNVILVLMESMDDWLFTEEDTPTLCKMRNEGIDFKNFYTPGYGGARTFNSEFCMNTGLYLPTTGAFVFNYVNNTFDESIASRMKANGFSSLVFHYNNPEFYSRGVFEKVMGYEDYISYEDYDKKNLYDDCLLFTNDELNDLFFREGQTFNTIITRSAHLSYKYNEKLSAWGLKKYPEYKGKYTSEEEDCARMKAKLVDDMFKRLLAELEAHGQLENTVIIGMTDHYTYGYKNLEELYALSDVDTELALEKTCLFVWSADKPRMSVYKTINTADVLPTMLNLLGVQSPYDYIGNDAFDPEYDGYAIFPDGSIAFNCVICDASKKYKIIYNPGDIIVDDSRIKYIASKVQEFIEINNLLLTSDYYSEIH